MTLHICNPINLRACLFYTWSHTHHDLKFLPSLSMQSNASSQVMIADRKINDLPSKDVNCRLLRALLKYAPTVEGKQVIASDIIVASEEENGLMQLARFYTTGLILPREPPFDNDGSADWLIVKCGGRPLQLPSRDVHGGWHYSWSRNRKKGPGIVETICKLWIVTAPCRL